MTSMRRLFSNWICDLLVSALPREKRSWAEAIRFEAKSITGDTQALLFALDALRGLALLIVVGLIFAVTNMFHRHLGTLVSETIGMVKRRRNDLNPRHIGMTCATGAALLGIAYLFQAGAPVQLIAVNAAALLLGVIVLVIRQKISIDLSGQHGFAIFFMGVALLITALMGEAVDGAARWVAIGPLFVQPSLILLPLLIVMFATHRDWISTAGVIIAALALAIQPDRAMAGVLLFGVAVLAIARRDRFVLSAVLASVAALAAALVRPDRLAAAPYVDQIFYTAFEVNLLAGCAVVAGLALLLVPALYGLHVRSQDRETYLVFGAVWLAVILAALIGNYPTPVVGYGGSAILGYVLSLSMLPTSMTSRRKAAASARDSSASDTNDRRFPIVSSGLT